MNGIPPGYILRLVDLVMGEIDLDRCSDPGHNVIAKHHFTEVDDGLTQNWFGRVFDKSAIW